MKQHKSDAKASLLPEDFANSDQPMAFPYLGEDDEDDDDGN